ncbi:hypothetical protein ACJ5ZS_01990 [Aeromonas salmonicida]|uniref:hypothetical protein n=1 Tax=Aeromonas salmonicida TaxID=645 RepID=UPI0038BD039E
MSEQLKQRVSRYISKSSDLEWPEDIVDFDNQSFVVNGIKPLVQVQDDIESAFVWCWSIKDLFINDLISKNKSVSKKIIENEINKHVCLTYCADIANRLKHGELRDSRSGQFAKLSVVQSILVNTEFTSAIYRLDGKYFIFPKNKDCAKIKANVNDENGQFLLDAYTCLHESLIAWDYIYSKFK